MLMRLWLEESGQGLDNVDWIHLVLASGKPVLQKSFLPQNSEFYELNIFLTPTLFFLLEKKNSDLDRFLPGASQ